MATPKIWLKTKDTDNFTVFFTPSPNAFADMQDAYDALRIMADSLNAASNSDRWFSVSFSKPRLYEWRNGKLHCD